MIKAFRQSLLLAQYKLISTLRQVRFIYIFPYCSFLINKLIKLISWIFK